MAAGRNTGVPELGTHGHTRGYKPMDNRFDIGNTLHVGGYQGHSGNTGWSDDAHMPFDQHERFNTGGYNNRFIGGSGGYIPNAYASNMQSAKPTLVTPATTSTHVTSNALITAPGTHAASELQPDAGQAAGTSQEQQVQVNDDDIAHHFVFRYYSVLYSNPAGIHNMYSKSGQLCKPDKKGERVVASGHNEIKRYYSQFTQNQMTAIIKKVEAQPMRTEGMLAVLVVGETTMQKSGNVKETRLLSQLFVICGDQTRSRYHILNDIAVTDVPPKEVRQPEVKEVEPVKSVEATPKAKGKPRAQAVPKSPPPPVESGITNGKEVREKAKIVIFGLPPNITPEELREALINHLKANLHREGRVLRVDIKRGHNSSEKFLLYAFVHVDSRETAEALVGEGLNVRNKPVNVEMYKRNNAVHEGNAIRGSKPAQNKAPA